MHYGQAERKCQSCRRRTAVIYLHDLGDGYQRRGRYYCVECYSRVTLARVLQDGELVIRDLGFITQGQIDARERPWPDDPPY